MRFLQKRKSNSTHETFCAKINAISDILTHDVASHSRNKQNIVWIGKLKNLFLKILNQHTMPKFNDNNKDEYYNIVFEHADKVQTVLNTFIKIHSSAMAAENNIVSKEIVKHLIDMLKTITTNANDDMSAIIDTILRTLIQAGTNAAKSNEDTSVVVYTWYFSVVVTNTDKDNTSFQLKYLENLNLRYFESLKELVLSNNEELLKTILDTIINDYRFTFDTSAVWDFYIKQKNVIDELNDNPYSIEDLSTKSKDIFTEEDFYSWEKQLDENCKYWGFDVNNKEIQNLKQRVKKNLYLNCIDEIIFSIGAFCYYKNNINFIKLIWEGKQPEDSHIVHAGRNVTPMKDSEVLRLFYKPGFTTKRVFLPWDGRHDGLLYMRVYFLLLLAKTMKNNVEAGNIDTNEQMSIDKPMISIPNSFSPMQLDNIIHSIDDLINISEDKLANNAMIQKLGLPDVKELFDTRVPSYLEALREEAKKRTTLYIKGNNISHTKVTEFAKMFEESIKSSRVIKTIHKQQGSYEKKELAETVSTIRFGLNLRVEKQMFLDDWYVSYENILESYAESASLGEDLDLFSKYIERSKETSLRQINSCFDDFENTEQIIVISGTTSNFKSSLQKAKLSFTPKYANTNTIHIVGCDGFIHYKDTNIPVYALNIEQPYILVLDKNAMGRMVQYFPILCIDSDNCVSELCDADESFYISVTEFSEEDILREINKAKSSNNIVNEDAIREEYTKSVHLQIFEVFRLIIDEGFKGYHFRI